MPKRLFIKIFKNKFLTVKKYKKRLRSAKKKLGRIPRLVNFQQYNFISPEVILSTKDTYYDVLKTCKEDIVNLDIRQYNILKFLSKEFTPAKRLYEILILEELLKYNFMSISKLETLVRGNLVDFEKSSFTNALLHLSLQIFTINAGRQDYEPLISINGQEVRLLVADLIVDNSFLHNQIIDIIAYNKLIYAKKYCQNKSHGLVMYAKYIKKEIAHLLNQDYTNGGVKLAGYRAFGNKVLLFITLDERKKFGVYDNKFLSQQAFHIILNQQKHLMIL